MPYHASASARWLWLPTCWLAPSAAPGPLHRTSLHDIRPVTPLVLSHFTALCLAPNCHCNPNRRASPQLPGLPQPALRIVENKRHGQTPRPVVGHSSRGPPGSCACPSNAPLSVVYPVTLCTRQTSAATSWCYHALRAVARVTVRTPLTPALALGVTCDDETSTQHRSCSAGHARCHHLSPARWRVDNRWSPCVEMRFGARATS
jgi:hypothetical protein